ncbi:hypothetical protein HDV04_002852, partial [Boothiomyces sp. JEL0838]
MELETRDEAVLTQVSLGVAEPMDISDSASEAASAISSDHEMIVEDLSSGPCSLPSSDTAAPAAQAKEIDILLLSETYLLPEESCGIPNRNIPKVICQMLPNRELGSGKRTTHGLMVYCKDSNFANQLKFIDESIRHLVLELGEFVLAFIYWNPLAHAAIPIQQRNQHNEDLIELLDQLYGTYRDRKLVICGDLNAYVGRVLNPNNNSVNVRGRMLLEFIDTTDLNIVQFSNEDYEFHQGFTTMATGRGNPDIVIANFEILDCAIIGQINGATFTGSDHLPVTFTLDFEPVHTPRNFDRMNIAAFADADKKGAFYGYI